jgi:hypothetical protein
MSQNSSGGACSDRRQGDALLRLKSKSTEAIQKTPFDFSRVRLNQNRKPLQVRAKLIAQDIGCVRQFGRDLFSLHSSFIGNLRLPL